MVRIMSQETKDKIRNSLLGKKHTKERRLKNSLSHTGKPSPMRGRRRPEISGENHPNWKGGTHKREGYVFVLAKTHHLSNKQGYVKRARLIAEKKLGRRLGPKEVVHHVNGRREDDRPCNIEIHISNGEHIAKTRMGHTDTPRKYPRVVVLGPARKAGDIIVFGKRTYMTTRCAYCSNLFWTRKRHGRQAKSCSQKCVHRLLTEEK